jgi:cell division protease FtsH
MSVFVPESGLPQDLDLPQAVEAAYAAEMAEVAGKLQRGLPVLIECDKELSPFLYMNLRGRLRAMNLQCLYLDGRPRQQDQQPQSQQQGMMPAGIVSTMINQLRDAVRGAVERRVVVLPTSTS